MGGEGSLGNRLARTVRVKYATDGELTRIRYSVKKNLE